MEDETVLEAIPSIGFVHRGLEKLVEKKDFNEYVYVAERICGICSFMHGMGYCMAVENTMDIQLPDRANFLRTIWAELSRLHSHFLWLGLLADAVGFESLFMHSWRLREQILDLFDMTAGGRVIFSVCKIGGVRKNMDANQLKIMDDVLTRLGEEAKEITDVFLKDPSIMSRLIGLGYLSKDDALGLGAVGPMLRASGVAQDMRTLHYAAYEHVNFEIPTSEAGDCYGRTEVRIREIFESIKIIKQCIALMPAGDEIATTFKGNPNGEFMARLEQPRGQVLYYVKGNGTKFLDRMRVRTPTLANIPALLHTLKGVDLADVPVLILTIDPCISCTER
jgi:ech hydrogenase subunit E